VLSASVVSLAPVRATRDVSAVGVRFTAWCYGVGRTFSKGTGLLSLGIALWLVSKRMIPFRPAGALPLLPAGWLHFGVGGLSVGRKDVSGHDSCAACGSWQPLLTLQHSNHRNDYGCCPPRAKKVQTPNPTLTTNPNPCAKRVLTEVGVPRARKPEVGCGTLYF